MNLKRKMKIKVEMNVPNKLSLLRMAMIPVFVVFASMDARWAQLLALALFIIASLTDLLDGKIARAQNLVTTFGKFIDPIADKLLVMSAQVVLASQGRMPAWVCVLILAREFIISGYRQVAAEGGVVIAAGMLGKIKTVTQMIAIILLFLCTAPSGPAPLGSFCEIVAQIALYVCTAMTVISGIDYLTEPVGSAD